MNLPGLFVTGTDTGVGKTWVSSRIVTELVRAGKRPGAMKPISSSAVVGGDGTLVSPDAWELRLALGWAAPLDRINPSTFAGDVAPHVAMRNVGTHVSGAELAGLTRDAITWWGDHADCLIVEGVGGLLCPLTDDSTVADLAIDLDFPLLIVARRGLGTLNHTLLTVEAARSRGLRIAGVVLNASVPEVADESTATNALELGRLLDGVPILAEWGHQTGSSSSRGSECVVDWFGRCQKSRRPA